LNRCGHQELVDIENDPRFHVDSMWSMTSGFRPSCSMAPINIVQFSASSRLRNPGLRWAYLDLPIKAAAPEPRHPG